MPPARSCSAAHDTACALPQTAARERPSGSRDNEDARPGVASDTMSASGRACSASAATAAAASSSAPRSPLVPRPSPPWPSSPRLAEASRWCVWHPGGAPTPQSEHILEVRVATSIVRCTAALRCTTALVHVAPQHILAKVCLWAVPSSRETRGLAVKPRYRAPTQRPARGPVSQINGNERSRRPTQ